MDHFEELAEIISLLKAEHSRMNGETAGMAYNSDGSEVSIDYRGFNRPSEY